MCRDYFGRKVAGNCRWPESIWASLIVPTSDQQSFQVDRILSGVLTVGHPCNYKHSLHRYR